MSYDLRFPSIKCNAIKPAMSLSHAIPCAFVQWSALMLHNLALDSFRSSCVWGHSRLLSQEKDQIRSQTKCVCQINPKKSVSQQRWLLRILWVSMACSFPRHLGKDFEFFPTQCQVFDRNKMNIGSCVRPGLKHQLNTYQPHQFRTT